ncbi:MAG: 3'-5' exonuclease [Acholeplasmatales bacterium]|nr:3'-5' exonuclease [Acholeplasmatales bacterium]
MNTLKSIYDNYDYIICLDTETTGLDPKKCQIIDLGVICAERIRDEILITDEINALIKLQEKGAKLPQEIINLTHITDEMLEKEGLNFEQARNLFAEMLNKPGKKLIATYNAQFDLGFLRYFLKGCKFSDLAFLDILTIYKDRAVYPHKLFQAVTHYNLDDKVQNTHRALDDTLACFEVLKSMSDEKDDIIKYVNLFGYNPKYGAPEIKIKGITYKPQPYVDIIGKPLYED